MMPLTVFVEPVTVLLGDRFGATKQSQDIVAALRFTLNMGRVAGVGLSTDRQNTSVDITTAQQYGQLVLWTVYAMVAPDSASYSVGTRGYGERYGDGRHVLYNLEQQIVENEQAWSSSWQSLAGFLRSFTSREDFLDSVIDFAVSAPFRGVTISAGGTSVNSGPQVNPDPGPAPTLPVV